MPEAQPTPGGGQAPLPQMMQGQPPSNFGSSPATGPSQNQGMNAAGMQKAGMVVKLMSEALPLVGASSELGQELLNSIKRLAKLVPAGSSTPQGDQAALQKMMMARAQQAAMMQQMQGKQAQQGGQPSSGTPPTPPTSPQG